LKFFVIAFYCFSKTVTYFTVENFINITGLTENPKIVKLVEQVFIKIK